MQRLLLSLGVPSKIKLNRERRGTWRPLYRLSVVGHTFVDRLAALIAPHSAKAQVVYEPSSGADKGWGYRPSLYGPLTSRVQQRGGYRLVERSVGMNETSGYRAVATLAAHPDTAVADYAGEISTCVQLTLESVTPTEIAETYDIEVDDVHLLSANGLYASNTRRAAKMVVLDVDHPDVEEFIWCKAREERKARVLEAAGYDMTLDSPDWASIQYQNANNSVRVTDAFMEAVVEGKEWNLTARTDGSVVETKDARDLLRQMAEAAWECADPGLQYDTTINSWHTCPNTGRINASNPCFPGDTRVHTTLGLVRFEELYERSLAGEEFRVYTHRATAEQPGEGVLATVPVAVMLNGIEPILRLRFANGHELRCTPTHRIWTLNRGYVEAQALTAEDRVLLNDSPTPATDASWALPVKVEALAKSASRRGTAAYRRLPERWSEGLAELTGHLIGDGCLTDVQTQWVYGGDDIEDGLCGSHEGMLRELIGGISRQAMPNGTVQLRAGSQAVRDLFRGLGVTSARAHEKRVPASVFIAPTEIQAAFLRGLFGADGCVSRIEHGKASRYVGLGSGSEPLLRDVQRLLNGFGIRGRLYRISGGNSTRFEYTRVEGSKVEYTSREGFDLRITGSDLDRFAVEIGFSCPRKQAALETLLDETERYRTKPATTLVSREEDGQEVVYNLTEPLHHSYIVDGVLVANCSEYMHIDDSACNLASLNLMKFRREDGELDVEAFEHAVDVMFLAQEIAVGYSSYPTPEIERNAKAYRQLGLGYANLGALLMARGLPYDSDEGRAYAAAITALMTGRAYRKSAGVARRMGPFAGYQPNAAAMTGVIAKHRAAVGNIDHSHSVPDDLLTAARRAWDEALELGEVSGWRNSQATVLAPTGCLVGDSLVSTSRGLVRLRTLGDPVGERWQDLDVRVATDEGPRQASQFYVNGFEQVVSIETGRGYRIQGTPTHRVKVVDPEGNWEWRRFSEIREGDRVPLMLNGMVGEPQTVELPPLGDLYWTADFRSRVPREMTPELAELVGYFMGDGSLHAKGLRFCVANEDQDVVEHLADSIAGLFGLDATATRKKGYTEVSVNSVPLVLWWEACGFAKLPPSAEHSGKGWHSHIPDAVLHTNDREIYAAFIRGLFEADGTTTHGYVSWSTVSESFSRDVQTMLLTLGFVTTRKIDEPGSNWGLHPRFVLRLLDVAASTRYLEEIDFISVRKPASLWTGDHRQASRADHIPVRRALLDELAPENDSLRRTMLMALGRRGDVSRRSATALLERTADPELEHLPGFYYDTVATVETLDDQPTYDISVPDNVTYVANGFVSHNTISFMMDCDTTGVEPDFSLVKSKKLVGGGEITIVNKTVPMALEKLGYAPNEVEEIVAYIDERNTVVGAPYVKTEHYPVFDCAIGDRAISHMGHVKMMGAVQPFISGAISKCVVADTLVTSKQGLVRIGSLHHGEREDSFREMKLSVASLDGLRETDAFYYGGERQTIEVVLGSGHRIVGTPNHRLLVRLAEGGLDWKRLDEIAEGDQVATQYGDDLWSDSPARFEEFDPSPLYGSQKAVRIPDAMTEELAFLLGAYAAEGHTTPQNHTIRIANSDEGVITRLVEQTRSLFGIEARVTRADGKCPSVDLSSKTLVEFFTYLGCGGRASTKRIPDAVLRSPRHMVLAFLEGLSLDSYFPSSIPKWAICLASNGLLDDLQAVLTNLGVVHNRITKHNAAYDTSFDEVYAHGRQAQKIASLLRFPEAHKQARATALLETNLGPGTADLVPGVRGRDLYDRIPLGRSGRSGRGTGRSREFRHLVDQRTAQVSRASLESVAILPGVELPDWLEIVLQQNLHFSPVSVIRGAGVREVYDISVPVTHAFVGNGVVNHNTVNLPEQITVDEVAQLFIESWQLGVKAIAIYRDSTKVAQPLAKKGEATITTTPGGAQVVVSPLPQRRRLPEDRVEVGRKFRVGEYEGYIHVGLFEDGTPGDIFVDIAKEGTTLAGLMNSFMISVSLGLQYGVPLEVYVSKFSHMRFEPSGMTNDPDIRVAKSIVDYIFRWMGKKFLSADQQEEAGILTPEVKARLAAAYNDAGEEAVSTVAAVTEAPPPGQTALFNQWEDAVECSRCGGRMVRTGSCYTCRDCGSNTGCS
jgi:ribonucleoside-diphosphate reductase alpha chain